MLRMCIVGGLGRMGRALAQLAQTQGDIMIVSVWEAPDALRAAPDYTASGYGKNPVKITSRGDEALADCEVAVDFSLAGAFDSIVAACTRAGKPLVTGTTGIADKQTKLVQLAGRVAVVDAPNMAAGVNVIFALCSILGKVFARETDIEIVETHHRCKLDVPSGTALEMARRLGGDSGREITIGRAGGPAGSGDIAIHSLRMGDVAGEHRVRLAPGGETIEISHTALSRACFAAGALRAARFAAEAAPGLYDMLDVLGLKQIEGGSS
jgi:4-hydroxy-tetrahydrodipicolinate reductase